MTRHSPDSSTMAVADAHPPGAGSERPSQQSAAALPGLWRSLEEVLGPDEARSYDRALSIAGLVRELEHRFGREAGLGIAHRLGVACFGQVARQMGDKAGLTSLSFRLLPPGLRLRQGLLALRGLLVDFGGRGILVQEQDSRLFWRLQDCPICAGRTDRAPICHLMLGMLSEAARWVSGGKDFSVQEIACRARGDDDCLFLIDPAPLQQ